MTVPEENSPKTTTTDEEIKHAETTEPGSDGASGRTMGEALEEAGLTPDNVLDAAPDDASADAPDGTNGG